MENVKIVEVNGNERVMVKGDVCPLCGGHISGEWGLFHGEITSWCCNSPYQMKDFSVSDDVKPLYEEYFQMYKEGYKELKLYPKYIQPMHDVIKETGIKNINDPVVIEKVVEIAGMPDD